jgi:hypothetical protein
MHVIVKATAPAGAAVPTAAAAAGARVVLARNNRTCVYAGSVRQQSKHAYMCGRSNVD